MDRIFARDKLKNKTVYIYPYSELTVKLKTKLDNYKVNFKGFLDKIKIEDDVYNIKNIEVHKHELILVCSPNHSLEILNELKKYNTILVHYFDNKFFLKKIPYYAIIRYKIKSLVLYQQYKMFFLKNKHSNDRAFIIGNGPSLNVYDVGLLKDEVTFAANKIWLLFDQTEWRPTYYSVTDKLVMKQNIANISKVNSDLKFFPDFMDNEINKVIPNSIYFKESAGSMNFNLKDGLDIGPTVVYTLIGISIYMGIGEIYLLGLDHDFTVPEQYRSFKKGDSNVIVSGGEVNHFHKDYRKKGEKWAQPELELLEEYYKKVKKYADMNNIKIYNASRCSKLEVFDRICLDDVLQKKH